MCNCCSHWQSSTSVLRPGTFLMRRGSTSITWKPRSSSTPNSGIQYTPVDSMTTVSTSALGQPVRQTVQVRREGLELSHRLLRPVGGHRHEMAGSPHANARRVQVQLGQPFRFSPALASAHHRLYHCRVGVSPEGAADCSHSPQRDRPDRGVTNDAVVRLPDHATKRAIRTSVCSVFVRTARLAMSIHPWADAPVSHLCTGRTRA